MKNANYIQNLLRYLKKHDMKSLIAGCCVLIAGISIASIGGLRLNSALQIWLTSNNPWGPSFDTMMGLSVTALVLLLPSILFFVVAYLLIESHALGQKISFILSIGCLLFGAVSQNAALALAGILCFWGAEIEFLKRRKIGQERMDSPVVTENIARLGLFLSGLVGILILSGIIFYTAERGNHYITWSFVTGANWSLQGIAGLIAGTSSDGSTRTCYRFFFGCRSL